ncbi:MAG: hypothetical protein N3F04_06660 [Candidatus Nezhaarchaeota archaeon]|nr:hypothetical protein [Candidatus Nezhaarchaeota archaeon]MCX8142423.1 hypothetical protein [Candidatus Nezhaarchaeota archaeon]MDW8050604.1 hypothetical protein [Nitrososphaerota archaeon]
MTSKPTEDTVTNLLVKELDEAWPSVLGYRGDPARLLDKLHRSLASEMVALKRTMMSEETRWVDFMLRSHCL